MEDAVRSALDASRSPPEIAYAIGEIVHNYFRTRGVTLTSYELRRLVAELLALRQARRAGGPLVHLRRRATRRRNVVDGRRAARHAGPVVPDAVFEGPPSRLVDSGAPRSDAALLAAVTAKARAELAAIPRVVSRARRAGRRSCGARRVLAGEPKGATALRGWP